MKTTFFTLALSLLLAGNCLSQNPAVDCATPYESSLKVSRDLKLMLERIKNTNRSYTTKSFKDYEKFDAYIACAKKNQGENSEDARKILELKNEIATIVETNQKNVAISNTDSAKNVRNKKEVYDLASKTLCPKDAYTGSDKAALKTAVINAWAKDPDCLGKYKILKVYITGISWSKEKGYNYSKSNDSFKKYDESFLDVSVVYVPKDGSVIYNKAEAPDVAEIFHYSLVKDHINKGKVDYIAFSCHHLNADGGNLLANNNKYILKSNVK